MKNKKFCIITFLIALLALFQTPALASKLPNNIWEYIKTNLPDAKQRFDSVITLKNDIMYIPLYPPSDTNVDKIKIEYTYPSGKALSDLPEVVLLNNGYSLLKVFKDKSGNYTLTKQDELPIKVRLGLMPQDMLTPVGLILPESLKLTLGDLLIPTKDESTLSLKPEEKAKIKSPFNPVIKRNEFIAINEFSNKKIFINPKNSKFIEVYDAKTRAPLYELKLASMPFKIITSSDNSTAIVLYWSEKKADIIDLKNENVIKSIPIGSKANDAVYNEKENMVYVASESDNKVFFISLNSMELKKVVKLDQKPSRIAYSAVDNSIVIYDDYQSKLFNITANGDDYIVQPIGTVPNVSKILADTANIYALSRTQNQIFIFDKVQAKLIKTIDIDIKPTDAILYNTRLYIICAKNNKINVYDTVLEKVISREEIQDDGFYSKITLLSNNKDVLITGSNTGNYVLYNLDKMEIIKKQDSYVNASNIMILDKEQRL